ncbi:hypothetical protein DFS34DRAFT_605464 [Phlyctochytrium arcticum]|nr:hypothetical protein DFS34DRAFT_605464 [Phlyctochytrium arcticum]
MTVSAPTSSASTRQLFGGGITADIPESFLDASIMREVPDNQEVFVDQLTDQSIILELLELAAEASDDEAAKFHFQQLADDNDASESQILSIEHPDPSTSIPSISSPVHISTLVGQQTVAKFRERDPQARNFVAIYMAVIRLPHVTTDLVLSYNHPLSLGAASSSNSALAESGGHVGVPEVAMDNFQKLLRSLRIVDWGLFGGSNAA